MSTGRYYGPLETVHYEVEARNSSDGPWEVIVPPKNTLDEAATVQGVLRNIYHHENLRIVKVTREVMVEAGSGY